MNPIFPSILSTDCFNLQSKLLQFNESGVDYIHLDIMDGHFVDNLSFGPSLIEPLKRMGFNVDSHLMVSNPSKMIPKFIEKGSDWVSFHIETKDNIVENLKYIRANGCKAGLALNPDTEIEQLCPYFGFLDYILIMSVFPGYGGQKFITQSIERAKKLSKEIKKNSNKIYIQMDGGLTGTVLNTLKGSGVELYVVGTHLYKSEAISDKIAELMKIINGE